MIGANRAHLGDRPLLDAMSKLRDELATPPSADELLLLGRRQFRTNNSWIHNVPAMVSGRERCVLLVNPEDAARAGIHADGEALLESRVHTGPVTVKITDEIRAGVVSLPHGWGHAPAAPWQKGRGRPSGCLGERLDRLDGRRIGGRAVGVERGPGEAPSPRDRRSRPEVNPARSEIWWLSVPRDREHLDGNARSDCDHHDAGGVGLRVQEPANI